MNPSRQTESPTFWGIWYQVVVEDDFRREGPIAFVPWRILLSIAICSICGLFLPVNDPKLLSNLITLYAALITAEGIILAMMVASFQSLLSNISSPGFSAFLKTHGLLPYYLYFIQFYQVSGIVSLVTTAGACVLLLVDPDGWVVWVGFSLSLGFFLYSAYQAYGCSILIRDVTFWRGEFDALPPESRAKMIQFPTKNSST